MRIPTGVTDQYIYFVAVDATDLSTRETGLSAFTVYRSRNGGAAAAMTTPTINETDATNMPGVYELLLDEDMDLDAGDYSQEMVFHITQASMAPVTRTIELYRSPAQALASDTYAEPGQGAPPATASLADKIGYMYKTLRNRKTATSTLINIYADDGTTVDQKRSVSYDGTTLDEGEIVSGP